MNVRLWLWQFQNEYPGNIGSDDTKIPVAEFWGKVNDGLNWQGVYDNHPAEFNSAVDVLEAERDLYGKQGIEFVPWGVVRGVQHGQADYAKREGALAAAIAMAAAGPGEPARYVVDLEPYYHGGPGNPQFWRNDLGAGPAEVKAFIDAFVAGGGQELWIAPDARPAHLGPVSFATWAASPVVKMVCPQVYFTDFKKPPKAALDAAIATLAAYGVPASKVHPALPGDGTPADLVTAVTYAREQGCAGVSFWRRGTIRKDSLEALGNLADPWDPAPSGPSAADVEAVRGVLRTLALDVSIAGRALVAAEKELTAVKNTLDAMEQRRVAALARLGGE